ncbi:MAG TPA: hypothetical protein VHX44_13970 [Planctomycetota bacterium]|jgi:hypothetical protein|nr:hypothetical protein [Planctomycetota bacterium]
MQNNTITTTAHRNEVEVSTDWADEAEALAQRVTSKLRQPTPATPQQVVPDEYEPQALGERKPSGRLTKRS